MVCQRTLQNSIRTTGVGLHTGSNIYLTLHPAPVNTGIVFRRVDLDPVVEIPASAGLVGDTTLSTSLMQDGARVSTIEHLMSALAGLGIDNLYVDLTGPEIPIMDGSAAHFVFLLQSAGIQEQQAAKRFVRIKKEIKVEQPDGKVAIFRPYNGFKIAFTIEFNHPVFKDRTLHSVIDFSSEEYVNQISRARTFGFMHEIEYLRSQGLARGGSMDNAIVVDEYQVLNKDGLRFEDEFVKHKILDAIGDLYTLGYSIIGEFEAVKSGHGLNNIALKALLDQPDAWEEVTFDDASQAPIRYLQGLPAEAA